MVSKIVNISGADDGVAGHRESGRELAPKMFAELLRNKTVGRKIQIPIHVVLAKGDHLIDNEKTFETLQSQSLELSSETVSSTKKSLRHQFDYGKVWREERQVIDGFIRR